VLEGYSTENRNNSTGTRAIKSSRTLSNWPRLCGLPASVYVPASINLVPAWNRATDQPSQEPADRSADGGPAQASGQDLSVGA